MKKRTTTTARLHVLIVDDEQAIRQVLASQIAKVGYEVEHVGNGKEAIEALSDGEFDICICDIRLPDVDGVEVLRATREAGVDTSFLMMTAFASVDTAVEAMRLGAYDYLTKPLRYEDVLRRLTQIADVNGLREENRRLRELIGDEGKGEFESKSEVMRHVNSLAAKVARTDGTVLITGESGTGKTFLARRIHEMSSRAERPFVSVNCGAIPENLLESEFFGHVKGAFTGADHAKKGLFREADGGTLMLDEIFELPLSLQVKLLHVLEEKEVRPVGSEQSRKVDVRIISATNRDVEKMVAERAFREDLFYRLNVLRIQMPPLRERRDDLPELIRFFVSRGADRLGLDTQFTIDPIAEEVLVAHRWSGNLRELQNVIDRALVLAESDEITIADLPPQVTTGGSAPGQPDMSSIEGFNLREQVRNFEVRVIREAIAREGGDRQLAARHLGIGLSTLYRKLEEIEPTSSKRAG
jgi:two-component system response regulator AtoC